MCREVRSAEDANADGSRWETGVFVCGSGVSGLGLLERDLRPQQMAKEESVEESSAQGQHTSETSAEAVMPCVATKGDSHAEASQGIGYVCDTQTTHTSSMSLSDTRSHSPRESVVEAGRASPGGYSAEEGTTPLMFFVNITKAYLGGGAVLLPEAILFGGFVLGPAAILTLAFVLNHTMKLLIRMQAAVAAVEKQREGVQVRDDDQQHTPLLDPAQQGEDQFESSTTDNFARHCFNGSEVKIGVGSIGEFCYGKAGRIIVNTALLCTNIGIVISYINLNTESFQQVLFGEKDENVHYQVVLWSQGVLISFLCMLNPKQLSFSSLLGNVAVVVTMVVVIVNSILFMENPDRNPITPNSKIYAAIGNKYISAVPNIFFSFVMHGTILSQFDGMQPSKRREAPRQLNNAAFLVSFSYAIFATVAYVAYYDLLAADDYKAGTSILLLLVPQSSSIVRATTSMLSVAILLSIPLFMDGVFDALQLTWTREDGTLSRALNRERPFMKRTGVIALLRILVVFPMVAILSLVKEMAPGNEDRPDPLQFPLKITGAVAMSWLGCIIPALLYVAFARRGVETFNLASVDGFIVMVAGFIGVGVCIFGVK